MIGYVRVSDSCKADTQREAIKLYTSKLLC